MRVFFDASVIIAAMLSPTGGSAYVLKYVKAGKIAGVTSQTVINEILEEDKTKRLKKSKAEIENFIAKSGLVVREEITLEEIEPYQNRVDAEDAHLIAGANLTKCAYLVSLDKKHLIREDIKREFLPLKIVSPKELIEEILTETGTKNS